jgi:tRNA nucleotidyltransferase (CCA-adding enzyme)
MVETRAGKDARQSIETVPCRLDLSLPVSVLVLLRDIRTAGGRALLVGGAVRDALLGRAVKDIDLEVYGLPLDPLEALLARHGSVDRVGQAFSVLKLSGLAGVTGSLDVSLPRRDSKGGPGHRGIVVAGDPQLSVIDAARRGDFTINALLFDPLQETLLDPFNGRADLERRVLRAVDPGTFGEDPLRALRAVQFAARFELSVAPETARLCAAMPLAELPAERIYGEIQKLLLHASRPSLGLGLLHDWGLLARVLPECVPLAETPQDPGWHPEGDVWIHTLLVVDRAARLIAGLDEPRAITVMLAALCHDLGKPATTRHEDGRLRSRGHEEAGVAPTRALLDRLGVHTLNGYDVRAQVLALVAQHLKPGQLYDERERVSDGAIRRLAAKCEPRLLYIVAKADCLGRAGDQDPVAMEWFLDKIESLAVTSRPPAPLLLGRDILALGVAPGPRVGRILRELYERQLDGALTTAAEARAEAQRLVRAETP